MSTNYLLGIDGGGSKTEFLLTDFELNPIESFMVKKGSNPWHGSIEQTLSVLEEGINMFKPELLSSVSVAYAGISGCFGTRDFNEQIQDSIEKYVQKAVVSGDLQSSFRAQSTKSVGLLALAGTGSVIAHFKEDGSLIFFDGVGYGGRECGYMVWRMYELGHISHDSALGKFIKDYFDKQALTFTDDQNLLQRANNPEMLKLTSHLYTLDYESESFAQLKQYLDIIILRWVYKLCALADKYRYEKSEEWELVLAGGFWNYDYIRENVVKQLQQNLHRVTILYSKEAKPILGCIKLARDISLSTT